MRRSKPCAIAASATAGLNAATALPELSQGGWGAPSGNARREPEPLVTLQAFDVEHLPAFGYREVNRLAGLRAQRLQQRECEAAELAAAGDYARRSSCSLIPRR